MMKLPIEAIRFNPVQPSCPPYVAMRRGIRVPQDLAVVGYDNFAESAYFWPSLTTINYNHNTLGCRAVQEVVKQIESGFRNERVEPQTILLLPDLVLRGSSLRKKG